MLVFSLGMRMSSNKCGCVTQQGAAPQHGDPQQTPAPASSPAPSFFLSQNRTPGPTEENKPRGEPATLL